MAASAAAEAAVKKLARLPGNTTCPNCGTQKNFGFSTVCIKYLTFVCNNCKAGHQAISHRCKSLTMSSWTEGEVLALKKAGNDRARATWLAKAPPPGQGGRPKDGVHIDVFKSFIVDVYERKRYYEEGGEEEHDPAAPPKPFATVKAVASPRQRFPPPTPHNTMSAPVAPPPAAPAIADLLDFGAFESSPPTVTAPPPQSQAFFSSTPPALPPKPQASPATFDAFGGFSSQAAAKQPPSSSATVPPPSDPFGFQPTTMQASPSFDPFNSKGIVGSTGMTNTIDEPPVMKNVTGLANGPTPVMASSMPSPFNNPVMNMNMQQPSMGNGMMGNNGMVMMMGGPMGGPMGGTMGGPMMGGNVPMMMGNNNAQMMMMMNAQQQMMMARGSQANAMTMMTTPGIAFPGNSSYPAMAPSLSGGLVTAMGGTATSTLMSPMGPYGGTSSVQPFGSQQQQQPKKYDPFAGIGL